MSHRHYGAMALGLIFGLALLASPTQVLAQYGGGGSKPGNNNNNNNKPKKGEYKAGSGAAVKAWSAGSLEEAKKAGKPICLYVYDSRPSDNQFAKFLESDVLANSGVGDALKGFSCYKCKEDDKGWPAEWLNAGASGAALILVSTDGRVVQIFSRAAGEDGSKPGTVKDAAKGILDYEKKLVEQAEKAKARAEADKAAEKSKASPAAGGDKK
ncbi:MAG: hypothetical protein HY291_16145 [Planctomycetes bacterium]|nr:hypothetical protein [Planctomycetota bacterium]